MKKGGPKDLELLTDIIFPTHQAPSTEQRYSHQVQRATGTCAKLALVA